MNPTHAYYIPGQRHLIATANADGTSTIGGDTTEQIQATYPGAQLMPLDEAVDQAMAATEIKYLLGPTEIDLETWEEMLNVLPPAQWRRHGHTESFKMIEATAADITSCYVRVGQKYYHISERYSTPHSKLVELCQAI